MGDFSRNSNDPRKHYSGVLMQQGRVQVDADWNEQLAIQLYRTEIEARDVIGLCGVPKKTGGFKIGLTPNALDLTISPGRIYVGGMLCELDATPVPVTFVTGAPTRVSVGSLYVDGEPLGAGQWVEISAANKSSTKLLLITAADPVQHVITFDASVLDYQTAGPAFIRRVATLLTQANYTADTAVPGGPASPLTSPLRSPLTSPLTSPPSLPSDGFYLVYIDAWKREITALDDPHIREVALGGPDTGTRLKNVWQVKLLRVGPAGGGFDCETNFAEWNRLTAPGTGTLNARTKPPGDDKDLCLLPPTAGYTRLENQLYRVEVQRGGDRTAATFKWSRDNAAVRTSITKVNGDVLTVADVGRDEVLSFAGDQWVEITDEESILRGTPRQLFQIKKVDPSTHEITLKTAPPPGLGAKKNLQLVRWEQTVVAGPDGVAMTADWIDLEGGVQVRFSAGTYRAGDFWLIPARTATGEIEWPPFTIPNTDPSAQPPLGIRHYFCRLALLEVKGGIITLHDCRKLFPPLTDICAEDVCFDNTNCQLPEARTVQEAIDQLCERGDVTPGIHITAVNLLGTGTTLRNDTDVSVVRLVQGIRVTCDQNIFPNSVRQKPTCFVTVFLPFPFNAPDRDLWGDNVIGRQPVLLEGIADTSTNVISWRPAANTQVWLVQRLIQMMKQFNRGERVLATLTLRGNFIWAQNDPRLYLDGNAFGFQPPSSPVPSPLTGGLPTAGAPTDIHLPSGDGKRGGDFKMWFWLVEPLTLNMALTPPIVTAGGTATGTLTLNRPAPAGGMLFNLGVSNPAIPPPPPVIIPAGGTAATFVINAPLNTSATVVVNVTASSGEVSATQPLTIEPLRITLTLNQSSIGIGGTATGNVTLSRPVATPGGLQVRPTGNPTTLAVFQPTIVTVPVGQTTTQFTIRAGNVPGQFRVRAAFVAATAIFDEKDLFILEPPR